MWFSLFPIIIQNAIKFNDKTIFFFSMCIIYITTTTKIKNPENALKTKPHRENIPLMKYFARWELPPVCFVFPREESRCSVTSFTGSIVKVFYLQLHFMNWTQTKKCLTIFFFCLDSEILFKTPSSKNYDNNTDFRSYYLKLSFRELGKMFPRTFPTLHALPI